MFLPYNTNEKTIFPRDLDDFIPEGAPVRLISNVIDRLDLSKLLSCYENNQFGCRGYHPAMMLKVIIYGYMNNIFSTRGLEEAMTRDVHLLWMSCYQCPDHTTINRFKSLCCPEIKTIFAQIVAMLAAMGEIKIVEDLYVDGTTIRSRAARYKIKWRKSAERYSMMADEKIQELVKTLLELIDEGLASDRESMPTHFTTEQARVIADAVEAKLEGRKAGMGKVNALRKVCDKKDAHDETVAMCGNRCGVAPADPECGIMHAKEDGYDGDCTPNYNVQIATNNQYVTNFEAYDCPNDKDTAIDFIDMTIQENGVAPKVLVEDAGYGCEEVYTELEARGIEAVVKFPHYDKMANRRPVKPGEYDKYGFHLTEDQQSLTCPAGHRLEVIEKRESYTLTGFRSDITIMHCTHHTICPFASQCRVAQNKGQRTESKLGNVRETEKALKNLSQPHNQEKLKRRQVEPEPVFGQLKYNKGFQRFSHFGKSKVRMELGFIFIALNLLKLSKKVCKTV